MTFEGGGEIEGVVADAADGQAQDHAAGAAIDADPADGIAAEAIGAEAFTRAIAGAFTL